tara:strand:- start:204 stop:413 length:210 start_codon:yes stop_codon:yes gene_type:complete
MKLFFKGFLLVLLSLVLVLENYAISNLQISRICRKERKEKACLKRLKLNRELLDNGKPIEIPVYPYKSK